jgi:hypothetical protein
LQRFTATGSVHANLGVAWTRKGRRLGSKSRARRHAGGVLAVGDLLISWG